MAQAGLTPLLTNPARTFSEKAYLHAQYLDIEGMPAFKDYIYRIKQTRDGMYENLTRGDGLDKWGKNHDDEIRAVIHTLNTILYYMASIKEDFGKSEEHLVKFNRRKDIDRFGGLTAADLDPR